jgi:hypothetical protein
LRLVEAVDLVEEEDRALAARPQPLGCACDDRANVPDRRGYGGELLERGSRRCGDDARQRRLPAAGRPVEHGRGDAVVGDGTRERGALAHDLTLTNEILQPLGTKPQSQGSHVGESLACRICEEIAHRRKYAPGTWPRHP